MISVTKVLCFAAIVAADATNSTETAREMEASRQLENEREMASRQLMNGRSLSSRRRSPAPAPVCTSGVTACQSGSSPAERCSFCGANNTTNAGSKWSSAPDDCPANGGQTGNCGWSCVNNNGTSTCVSLIYEGGDCTGGNYQGTSTTGGLYQDEYIKGGQECLSGDCQNNSCTAPSRQLEDEIIV